MLPLFPLLQHCHGVQPRHKALGIGPHPGPLLLLPPPPPLLLLLGQRQGAAPGVSALAGQRALLSDLGAAAGDSKRTTGVSEGARPVVLHRQTSLASVLAAQIGGASLLACIY